MTTATELDAEQQSAHEAHIRALDNLHDLPGKFLRPVKITMLGAGSAFTPKLVNDVLLIKGADEGEIALVDINKDRLSTMKQVVEKVIAKIGRKGWRVTATTDRLQALPGTDYLVNCIEVSGTACVEHDNDIPLKYGIDQCIGDTIGPGGLFKALRTGPVYLEILRDAEQLCPDAWVLNYTNPMNILCLAAGRTSSMNTVGLCHSVQGTSFRLAQHAGIPLEELTFTCAGINHLAWFVRLEHGGKSLYPLLLEKVKGRTGKEYEADPVRYDMMMHFGAFITESSGHLSEYLPYYRKNPELVKEYCRSGYRGESRFYASNWPTWRKEADAKRMAMVSGEEPVGWQRTWEYASWIIEGREKDVPVRIYGNVMNNAPGRSGGGQLITNLPSDGCVEVSCMVDRAGIHPTRFGELPAQMAGLCASNMAMFDLAATACIEKSKEAAIHALMHDPLTAALCTPAQIKQMTLEMFEAEKDFLGGYQ